jgi:hypothetical protein
MSTLKNCVRPARVYLAVVLLLLSSWHQPASAAMIGTEKLLQTGRRQDTCDYLYQAMARQEIRNALIDQGIDPREAQLRIESLSDEEIALIADKINDLSAGSGVFMFSLIIIAVIVAAFITFNYTSVADVFP